MRILGSHRDFSHLEFMTCTPMSLLAGLWTTVRHRTRESPADASSGSNRAPSCALKRHEWNSMPELDFNAPRLFVDAALERGERSRWSGTRAIISAMCCGLRPVKPSWCSTAATANGRREIGGRKRPDSLTILTQTRPQDRLPDIAYVFAPLKHARLDYMVQKAVEMGAARLQPVLTRFTQVSRVNGERMRANVDRGRRAMRHPESRRGRGSDAARPLRQPAPAGSGCWCSATRRQKSLRRYRPCTGLTAADGIDILIGPEGGFAEEERVLLLRQPKTLRLCLGPPNPAGGYRGRRGAGAGAGRTRRLGRAGR